MAQYVTVATGVQTYIFHFRGSLEDCCNAEIVFPPIKAFDMKILEAMDDRFL
jgi:hypothetical protein